MTKGRPRGSGGKARVLSKKEIEVAITAIKTPTIGGKYSLRNSTILATSYYLGLRAKELAGLKIGDVQDMNGEIDREIQLTVTKGSKPRTIYIPDSLSKILKAYIQNSEDDSLIHIGYKSPLFKSQKGSSFSANTMQSLLKQMYMKCGLDGCSSHTGRRSFATRLIEEGADIKAVSSLMGHTSINMTAKYVEDNPERLRSMLNNML